MKEFLNDSIDLGTVKVHSKNEVVFKYIGDKEIGNVTSACGCTTPVYNKEDQTISATYTAAPVPVHLDSRGYYRTTKTLFVYDTHSNLISKLFIIATVKK